MFIGHKKQIKVWNVTCCLRTHTKYMTESLCLCIHIISFNVNTTGYIWNCTFLS